MGFCGEVLFSIGVVSCLVLISCWYEGVEVWVIWVEGGIVFDSELFVHLFGICVEVWDFFYVTLVCFKFMKS